MELNFSKIKEQNPKNIYRFTINTMEGDADDYHSFEIDVNSLKEAKEMIIYCEVMSKQYKKNGRGGGSGFYDHLDFFDEFFDNEWHYEDGEWMDSWEDYSLVFFNKNGEKFRTSITFTDEDKAIIDSYEVKN